MLCRVVDSLGGGRYSGCSRSSGGFSAPNLFIDSQGGYMPSLLPLPRLSRRLFAPRRCSPYKTLREVVCVSLMSSLRLLGRALFAESFFLPQALREIYAKSYRFFLLRVSELRAQSCTLFLTDAIRELYAQGAFLLGSQELYAQSC